MTVTRQWALGLLAAVLAGVTPTSAGLSVSSRLQTFADAASLAPFATHSRGLKALEDDNSEQSLHASDSTAPWVEVLSWKPRAFLYHNFLSQEEATYLVKIAKPQMRRSTVVGGDGKSVEDHIRTSYGTFLRRLQDPVVEAVETRLATWTKLDVVHQEDMQILRYSDGQKYGAHYDSLQDTSPRVITVLIYLGAKNLTGGETAFPQGSEWLDDSLPERLGPFSPCTEGHVAFRPRKGDALLFYSLNPEGQQDPASMHTGCPVLEGVKWTATKWIHTKPFNAEWLNKSASKTAASTRLPEDCENYHTGCQGWADAGECENNPSYMKGDAFTIGNCRLACKICDACASNDHACRQQNRVRAGFLPIDLDDSE